MTFKELYQNVAQHLQRAVDGKKTTFTHAKFYGYTFEIKAVKDKK